MKPLLTIVVPTKNRYSYLENFVKSFVAFDSSEIELVIQDNSDTQSDDFLSFLEQVNDIRIRYSYRPGWLSVVENCDLGIEAAHGDYVSMIGDDDGMLFKVSLDLIRYCITKGHDAVIVNKADYYWPDTSHAVWKDLLAGNVFYKDYTYQVKPILVESELLKVLDEGAARTLRSLPRIYHGFIKKDLLNELKSISGSYFPGPSPDMANAIGLSRVVKNLIEVDIPAVISGHSKKSGGGMGGEKKHHGGIESQSHLPKETSALWSDKIPKFWSGSTIYAESAKEALRRTNTPKQFKLNYTYLWAYCLVFESSYLKITIKTILKDPLQIPLLIFYVVGLVVFRGSNYIKNYFRFNNNSSLSKPAKNIGEAQVILNNLMDREVKFNSYTDHTK